jgi:hypothetical protein
MDKAPSGTTILQKADATGARPSQLRVLFLKYDADNSGGIDHEELGEIFDDVSENTDTRELRKLVRQFGRPADDDEAGEYAVVSRSSVPTLSDTGARFHRLARSPPRSAGAVLLMSH